MRFEHAGGVGDTTTFFYNPFRQRWVFSLKVGHRGPFTRADCVPIRADHTLQAIRWEGAEDLLAWRANRSASAFT